MRIEARGVSRRFGRVEALRDVSFEIQSGERVALIGPNGAGKSTLTRILMGLLSCEGEILLDGRSPFRDRAIIARELAYVPQVAPRLAATVGETVRTIAALRESPVREFETLAGELCLDLADLARRPLRDLSGGMRQKLMLVLALASHASLLILDEPTASLDVDGRRRFFRLAESLEGRPTILLCSHRLEEIRQIVQRALVLEEGRLRYDGDAQTWLRQTAEAVVEVQVASDRAEGWLVRHGFRRSAAGWWSRPVRNGERVGLLGEILSELRTELRDLAVREHERLPESLTGEGRP